MFLRSFSLNNCCTGIVSIKLIFHLRRIHVMCKKKQKKKKKWNKNLKKKKFRVYFISKMKVRLVGVIFSRNLSNSSVRPSVGPSVSPSHTFLNCERFYFISDRAQPFTTRVPCIRPCFVGCSRI